MINTEIRCVGWPCDGVRHDRYTLPTVEMDPATVEVVLISEAAPDKRSDSYYGGESSLFEQTTVAAFRDAGTKVSNVREVLALGVYLTTAVKCGKEGYGIKAGPIKACSHLLEREIAQFPNVRAYLLMGDVAIKAVNYIAARHGDRRVIPMGSTYKIRGSTYRFRGARAFPSYLQAGPAFFIEKSKRRMIAEDIASALSMLGG